MAGVPVKCCVWLLLLLSTNFHQRPQRAAQALPAAATRSPVDSPGVLQRSFMSDAGEDAGLQPALGDSQRKLDGMDQVAMEMSESQIAAHSDRDKDAMEKIQNESRHQVAMEMSDKDQEAMEKREDENGLQVAMETSESEIAALGDRYQEAMAKSENENGDKVAMEMSDRDQQVIAKSEHENGDHVAMRMSDADQQAMEKSENENGEQAAMVEIESQNAELVDSNQITTEKSENTATEILSKITNREAFTDSNDVKSGVNEVDDEQPDKVYDDDAAFDADNGPGVDHMEIGYDDLLLRHQEADSLRKKKRSAAGKQNPGSSSQGKQCGEEEEMDVQDLSEESTGNAHAGGVTKKRSPIRKRKKPECKTKQELEEESDDADEEKEDKKVYKDKAKSRNKLGVRAKHRSSKFGKTKDLETCMAEEDEELIDECSNSDHTHT